MDRKKCSQKEANRRRILTSGWQKPDVPECLTDVRLLAGVLGTSFKLISINNIKIDFKESGDSEGYDISIVIIIVTHGK